MSFLGFFKTIFDKLKSVFEEINKDEPAIEKVISITLNVVSPMLDTVLMLTGEEAAAAEINTIVTAIQTEMTNIQNTLNAAGPRCV